MSLSMTEIESITSDYFTAAGGKAVDIYFRNSFLLDLLMNRQAGLFERPGGGEKIRDWHTLPWYMLCAGVFGLILYQTINITLPRLGSTMMITLIITGQLLTGVVIDHFGWLGVPVQPINATRLMGVAVLLLGGYLVGR